MSRGWLGVLIQDITCDLAESFGMDKPQGALVAQVIPNSPASAAKFKVGDIIIKFGGKNVERSSDLPPIVGSTDVGSKVATTVIREGQQVILEVTIGELPSEADIQLVVTGKETQSAITSKRLALSVIDLDDNKREELSISEGGVLVQGVDAGPARNAGIRKGDVILMIDNINIENVKHFKEIVNQRSETTVPVLVHRSGSPLFLALTIPAH